MYVEDATVLLLMHRAKLVSAKVSNSSKMKKEKKKACINKINVHSKLQGYLIQ